jgi:hypothetical protein
MRFLASCAVVLAFLGSAVAAPLDPLRLIPTDANLILKVEKPRALVEAVVNQGAYREYQNLPQVREVLESTGSKRFFQLLAHAETKLGAKWPELLDTLAGGGIAIGTVAGQDPAPTLLVVQGTDEEKAKAAFQLLLQILTDELARQSSPDKPATVQTTAINGTDVTHVGEDFFAVRTGAALVFANKRVAMERGLALANGKADAKPVSSLPTVPAAKKLLGGDPLMWLWFNLDAAKQTKEAKDFFESTRKDFLQTMVVGSTVDAVRRAGFVSAGLFETDSGLKLSVKLPAKRADLPPEFALHVPMKSGVHGSLPLLAPPGVLYSQSFYLDLATFWTERKKLLNAEVLKEFEKGVADVSKVLPGTTLGKLLEMSGPHHRFVAVERGANHYKTVSDTPLPEMALVSSMKDPQFGKTMNTTLRTAAALASLGVGMSMSEEKVGDIDVVSYRFSETKPLPGDPTNIRFSFVPTFAVVNGFLVIASSPQLVKDLIPELKKDVDPAACSPSVWRNTVSAAGAASGLKARPDAVITDAVLGQGIGLDEAKKQVEQLAKFLNTLGTVGMTLDHTAEAYVFDVEWKQRKD